MWVALTREQAEIAWLMGQPMTFDTKGDTTEFARMNANGYAPDDVPLITRQDFGKVRSKKDYTLQDWIYERPACPNAVFAIWVED